jgi:fluoride exporter
MSCDRDRHPELPSDPDSPSDPPTPESLVRVDAFGLVLLGGFAGTAGRHGLALLEPTRDRAWPWGTFLANVAGAFVLGLLLELLARRGPDEGWRRRARLLLGTGFCGAFTTYSTLAVETDLLVRADRPGLAGGYFAATVAAGLVATVAGIALGSRRRGRAARELPR